ncbi:MAG: RES domain-containing protein [Bacteroidota bacterium]|nr:RES domain-containing protein [Bacteroidota bacterium]
MNCCEKCFSSAYLISIINADDRSGDCDFCNSKNVSLYAARELAPFFRNIISLYKVDLASNKTIVDSIKLDFEGILDVFDEQVQDLTHLLKEIFVDETDISDDFFTSNVSLEKKDVFLNQSSEVQNIWESFKEEIKFRNRYHIENAINLNKLETFFRHDSFYQTIKKGRVFYRCRISDKEGFPVEKMGNPPTPELATAGRANPKGISYLYLTNEIKTSLYETRATLYDYACVGEFKAQEDLKVLNLRSIKNDPIPWSEAEAIEDFLIYIPFIQTLQKEISLPIRKKDKTLDYIPTQYLSEFIKSLEYDGVEYRSSIYSLGHNLAIFNPDKFKCMKVSVHEIKSITLEHEQII